MSEVFVSKWRSRYQQDGTAGLGLTYQGRAGFLSESEKEKVLEWLGQQSASVSGEALSSYVQSQCGVEYRSRKG